jgi:hypothetical protein
MANQQQQHHDEPNTNENQPTQNHPVVQVNSDNHRATSGYTSTSVNYRSFATSTSPFGGLDHLDNDNQVQTSTTAYPTPTIHQYHITPTTHTPPPTSRGISTSQNGSSLLHIVSQQSTSPNALHQMHPPTPITHPIPVAAAATSLLSSSLSSSSYAPVSESKNPMLPSDGGGQLERSTIWSPHASVTLPLRANHIPSSLSSPLGLGLGIGIGVGHRLTSSIQPPKLPLEPSSSSLSSSSIQSTLLSPSHEPWSSSSSPLEMV